MAARQIVTPRIARAVFGLLVLVALGGCREHVDEDTLAAGDHRGQVLFMNHCSSCHGIDGRGKVLAARGDMAVVSSDLTTPAVRQHSDDSLAEAVRNGVGPSMPAFREVLTPEQTVDVVSYVRELGKSTAEN